MAIDIAIVGGGILGVSIAYFLSSSTNAKVSLIEQHEVASHSSTRNTGKVHAPFLYDPMRRRNFAKASFLGFDMWKKYCELKSLPFISDGVLEVATHDKGIDKLDQYMQWGRANGLNETELRLLESKDEVAKLEPNVDCLAAIYCSRDASVNYRLLTRQLAEDAAELGCKIMIGTKVKRIEGEEGLWESMHTDIAAKDDKDNNNNSKKTRIHTTHGHSIPVDFVINAAGGNAVDIAHGMGVAQDYTDLHFRGEYWEAPGEYHNLTKMSIYSVPRYSEYPFLDPHWILRADGRREIGPNAVPVFGPYAYNWRENMASFVPKVIESLDSGASKIWVDRQFISLALNELKSSLSKNAMIERVGEFLPQLKPSKFMIRGTAGIRSSLIHKTGKFVPDIMFFWQDSSLHILNYNSPGSTGALPIAAMLVDKMIRDGIVSSFTELPPSRLRPPWDIQSISQFMRSPQS